MNHKRFIRFRKRRKKNGEFHLELNSLLDVLVILLVFLIKNYTSSEVELSIPKDMKIPLSLSQSIVQKGVTLQMTKDYKILIEEKFITSLPDGSWNEESKILIKNELMGIKDKIETLNFESEESVPFSGVINLMMDRMLNFEHIQKLMDLSTNIGFEQFKFIVIEN